MDNKTKIADLEKKISLLEKELSKAKLIEEKVENREKELIALMGNIQGMVYQCRNDENWTMEFISDGCIELTGYMAEEIVHNNFISFNDIILKSDRDYVWKEVQLALDVKEKWIIEYRIETKDGGQKWVWEQGLGRFDDAGKLLYLEGLILDVSYRKEIEQQLVESENKYRKIFNNILDAYYETTLDGVLLEISPSIKNILGYSRSEILRFKAIDFYADKTSRQSLINELLEKKDIKNFEISLKHKNGQIVSCISSATLVEGKGSKPDKMIGSLRDISLLKNIKQERIKFLSAIEQSSVAVVITDLDGKIEFVNPQFCEITQYSKEEVIGHNPNILNSGFNSREVYDELWKTITAGGVWKGEFLNKRKNGDMFWEFATIAPVKNESGEVTNYIGVKEDITPLKNMQELLQESEEHYRKLFFEAPNGYQSLNENGIIIQVNPAWSNLIGYSSEDAIGCWVGDFLDSASQKKLAAHFEDFKIAGEIYNLEMTFVHKTGKPVNVIINGRVGNTPEGKFKQTHCILSDISDRKKYEQELNKAKIHAEESDRLKTAFLANMSHEIRTPMNAILGFSDLLRDRDLSRKEMDEYIDIINQRGNDLLQIISDIIDISRIEAGDIRMVKELIPVNQFLSDIYQSFAKIIQFSKRSDIDLRLISKDLPDKAVIESDRVRVKQVFDNLLQNALKFTSNGYIELGYTYNGKTLQFFVKDSGIGIEKKKQNLVFERFRQADDKHSRDYGGTGLGLAISKNIIELLGGTISLESDPGKGTTFYFTLPYRSDGKNTMFTEYGLGLKKIDDLDLQGKTILIAEDVSSNYLFLESLLKRFNAKIIWAKDGYSAIEYCKKNENIDMIMMDIRMPGINGYTATQKIREFNSDIPIIAQTAYALSDDKDKAIEAGCNAYLSKPINIDELKRVIREFI
ncbi:PAS domain S-box protein [Bacteroidota bacterium]